MTLTPPMMAPRHPASSEDIRLTDSEDRPSPNSSSSAVEHAGRGCVAQASIGGDSSETLLSVDKKSSKKYAALAGQFSIFVAISTFSISLIVSFLSFSHNMVDAGNTGHHKQLFNVGMLLAFISTGCHFGVIVVGGRAAALSFRMATPPASNTDIEANTVHAIFREKLQKKDFTTYVTYCERLLLFGTLFAIASMLFILFLVFSDLVYPLVLVGLSAGGAFTVILTGFWSISVMAEDIIRFVHLFSSWRRFAGAMNMVPTTTTLPRTDNSRRKTTP